MCQPHPKLASPRSVSGSMPRYEASRSSSDAICGWRNRGWCSRAAVASRSSYAGSSIGRLPVRPKTMAPTCPRPAHRSSSAAAACGSPVGRVANVRKRSGCARTASVASSLASRARTTASGAGSAWAAGVTTDRIARSIPAASIAWMRPVPMSSSLAWLSPMRLKATLSSRAPSGSLSSASRMAALFQCSSIAMTFMAVGLPSLITCGVNCGVNRTPSLNRRRVMFHE